jgi:hypothetical protein
MPSEFQRAGGRSLFRDTVDGLILPINQYPRTGTDCLPKQVKLLLEEGL